MKITDIDIIPIHPRLHRRYDNVAGRGRMSGIDHRLVFKVRTDNGLTGYGDGDWPGPPPPTSLVEPLIDRNPFDFLNNDMPMALGSALYDVMGKYLEVPIHKLLGPKLRDAGTVAAWTRPCPPNIFQGEIKRAIADGYTIFKMHTNPRYDPVEQARVAAEVAPEGFKIHFDFNGGGRTLAAVLPLVNQLEREHPIVGFIEDPLPKEDIGGWRELREKSHIPIVHGGRPALGGLQEIMYGMADIYMLGGSIADVMSRGIACAKANVQTILQLTGGTLMKAMTLHIASVLPTATGHSINLDDQYEEDITTEWFEVTEGYSRVPEGPGLGFEVDEEALRRLAGNNFLVPRRTVGILHLPGGKKVFTTRRPDVQRMTGREEGAIRGIDYEMWEDDGSSEFERIYQQTREEALAKGFRVD